MISVNGNRFTIDDGIPFEPKKPLGFYEVWCEETDHILRNYWHEEEPPEIATRINLWITKYCSAKGKNRNKTSDLGGGVITRARVLNMISIEDFTRLYEKYVVPFVE